MRHHLLALSLAIATLGTANAATVNRGDVNTSAQSHANAFNQFIHHNIEYKNIRVYPTGKCYINAFTVHPNQNDTQPCAAAYAYNTDQGTEFTFVGNKETVTLFSEATEANTQHGFPLTKVSMMPTNKSIDSRPSVTWKTPGICNEDYKKQTLICNGFDKKVGFQIMTSP